MGKKANDQNNWVWDRDGAVKKAAKIDGIGNNYDNLHVRLDQLSHTTTVWSLTTANNVCVFAASVTQL